MTLHDWRIGCLKFDGSEATTLLFNTGSYSSGSIGSGNGTSTPSTQVESAHLRVECNGTSYYIPLYD